MKKSNLQTVIFAIFFVTMIKHTYKLSKNVFNDFLTKSKGGINMDNKTTPKMSFDTISVKGRKSKGCFFINSTTVFNHQNM